MENKEIMKRVKVIELKIDAIWKRMDYMDSCIEFNESLTKLDINRTKELAEECKYFANKYKEAMKLLPVCPTNPINRDATNEKESDVNE